MSEERDLFLVLLHTGFDRSDIIRSALMFSMLAAAMDQDTVLYCVQAGADVMVEGAAEENDTSKPGAPTIRQRMNEALEAGVRFEVCEQTANVRNIKAKDLIEGAILMGGAKLIDYAIEAKGQLVF